MTCDEPQPIKIQLTSEIIKLGFIKLYAKYEHKVDSSAAYDLSPKMWDINVETDWSKLY